MRIFKTKVKCYQRKKSRQYLVTLKGEHGFKHDEPVTVLSDEDFNHLEALQDTARDYDHELVLKDKKISTLEEDLRTAREDLESKEREFLKLENRLNIYEETNKTLKENLQAYKIKEGQYEREIKTLKDNIGEHLLRIRELENLESEDYKNKYDKLDGNFKHLQERRAKDLEEINQLQKVITDLSNRGFTDYILGRQPESFKKLQAPEFKLNDKEGGP